MAKVSINTLTNKAEITGDIDFRTEEIYIDKTTRTIRKVSFMWDIEASQHIGQLHRNPEMNEAMAEKLKQDFLAFANAL